MTLIPVHCLHCESDQVVKRGKTHDGKQRYRCQNEACAHRSFLLEYSDRGRLPEVKQQIVDMALNGRGIRDTARVLKIYSGPLFSDSRIRWNFTSSTGVQYAVVSSSSHYYQLNRIKVELKENNFSRTKNNLLPYLEAEYYYLFFHFQYT